MARPKDRKYGAVLKNVQGLCIRQAMKSNKPTNEICICRGKVEVKKLPASKIDDAVIECARLAESYRVQNQRQDG